MSDSTAADSKPLRPFSLAHVRRTHCSGCFKDNAKFRCTGCQAMMYCSRECQKAAWRTHKPLCTSEPNPNFELQASDLGYPSPLSLFNALIEWIELRRWCLYTLACALVRLEGGVEAVLAAQKVLLVQVVPAHRTEHDSNPAMAFQFDRAAIVENDGSDFLRENWASIRPNVEFARLSSAFAFLDPARRDRLSAPVGSLPVVYVVHRTNIISGQAFPLLRLPLRHVDNQDVADGRTRAALEDLVRIMKAALCHVIVHRRAENPQQQEPDWGIFERTGRRRKTWKWTLLSPDQETWRRREKLLDQMNVGHPMQGQKVVYVRFDGLRKSYDA
ncbi:hypothetical protein LXA43DRAFT_1148444 [Ganoderma leucocontextum]|nr:hypothetical protein LXA43DRAFT_1148444 [Ganoderma leucocontextum]